MKRKGYGFILYGMEGICLTGGEKKGATLMEWKGHIWWSGEVAILVKWRGMFGGVEGERFYCDSFLQCIRNLYTLHIHGHDLKAVSAHTVQIFISLLHKL